MDADTLFENHSVEEVKNIERQLRHDIEWKKEEMRDLVGERYRDLISAADTIKEMRSCAENIGKTIGLIDAQCKSFRAPKPITTDGSLKVKERNKTAAYEAACQIKLLLAVPGRIWKYLDSADYLAATNLYLLAKHVHGSMLYDSHTGGQILSTFPVISKQWAAISYFKAIIIQICKQGLSDYSRTHEQVAVSLCCIMLLEEKTPRQVFQDFLVSRMYSIKGTGTVRGHVVNAIKLVHSTVFQIAALFCDSQSEDLGEGRYLARTLNRIVSTPILDQLKLSELSGLSRHLPKSVTGFVPSPIVQNITLTGEYLRSSCQKWLQSCLENIKVNVAEQLTYISSIKSLSGVKEAVFEAYNEDCRMKNWKIVCDVVLNREVNMWSDEITPIYTNRLQEIVDEHMSNLLTDMSHQLEKAKTLLTSTKSSRDVMDKEMNMSNFLWSESANDLPLFDKWLTSSQKTFQNGRGLLMKVYGFTPMVQSMCRMLDTYLNALLDEVAIYRQPLQVNEAISSILDNQSALSSSMAECLTKRCYQCVNSLTELVTTELDSVGKVPFSGEDNSETCWILFLARYYAAISHLCPALEKCIRMQTSTQTAPSLASSRSMSRSMSMSTAESVDPLWNEVNNLLYSASQKCYSLWKERIVESLGDKFRSEFLSSATAAPLHNVTRWADIEIDEVSEQGTSLKSTISVPLHITWCLQVILNCLCSYLNGVGSHRVARDLQLAVVSSTVHQLLVVYQELMDTKQESLSQTTALQILFDLWFLQGFTLWKGSQQSKDIEVLFTRLTEAAQSIIDPFDLDVFSPHLHSHLSACKSRSQVLFGAIVDTERVSNSSNRPTSAARHEQHNILPLYTSTNSRFPLLPVVSESVRVGHSTSVAKTPTLTAAASAPSVKPKELHNITKAENSFKQSSSFYDRIGSGAMSWFTGGSNK